MFQRIKICCFILLFCSFLQATDRTTQVIEGLGDVFQFLPAFGAAYALYEKDYEGLKELAIGFGISMGSVLISKKALEKIGEKSPSSVYFARRPNNGNYQGFPSGHTTSAFSAVGFLQKRYGWKFSLPAAILATFTGYSRVYAKKHTTFQVVVGAMLGFSTSYLSASKWIDETQEQISFDIQEDTRRKGFSYSLKYSRSF